MFGPDARPPQGLEYNQPPRLKINAAPPGGEYLSTEGMTTLPSPAQPSGSVNVIRIESSAGDSLHPGCPAQSPRASGPANGWKV